MLTTQIAGEPPSGQRRRLRLDWKRALGVDRFRLPRGKPAADRLLVRRLRRLDLARGPLAIEPIKGGISNHNFAVRLGGQTYFARLCEERPLLGINRPNELVCQEAAGDRGVAPPVIYHEPGLMLCSFVRGRVLRPGDLRDFSIIGRVSALLSHLHKGWDLLTGEILYFSPFQAIRTYARSAAQLGADLPRDIDGLVEDARRLERRIAPFRPVLCHNDLLPANLIDDGRRLWLVDWEYGGIGHRLFDLANASANAAFSDDQDRVLLEAYHGQVVERDLAELRIFKAVSFLREALWSTIQTVASDIDFDYGRYASDNLEAYRDARARLQ
jgi:thiamine kinase-like enzyme